jgi:hypothetical protein
VKKRSTLILLTFRGVKLDDADLLGALLSTGQVIAAWTVSCAGLLATAVDRLWLIGSQDDLIRDDHCLLKIVLNSLYCCSDRHSNEVLFFLVSILRKKYFLSSLHYCNAKLNSFIRSTTSTYTVLLESQKSEFDDKVYFG